jgi:hypothetical protein
MSFLVLKAYWSLLQFDRFVTQRDFGSLYDQVRSRPVGGMVDPSATVESLCAAVDMACIWYWREVLCLQRSAATTSLLRRYGVPAQLIIGAQQMPFKAHAWVEVNGRVVNDKSYVAEKYSVLDRC